MTSIVRKLFDNRLITGPSYAGETHYEVMMGSVAYGVNNDMSDVDIYAVCVPRKDVIFSHEAGIIPGFNDNQHERFDQIQKHHIRFEERSYDVEIMNIVKFFYHAANAAPNKIDALFVPHRCIIHRKPAGDHMRNNRKLFLSKKCFHSFKGYAFAQLNKARNKALKRLIDIAYQNFRVHPDSFDNLVQWKDYIYAEIENSNFSQNLKDRYASLAKELKNFNWQGGRAESIMRHGWDTKFGSHVIRLVCEAEQILSEGDLDLERNKEQIKAVRNGSLSLEDVEKWFQDREQTLTELLHKSDLPHSPQWDKLAVVLTQCLEMVYSTTPVNLENKNLFELAEHVKQFILSYNMPKE